MRIKKALKLSLLSASLLTSHHALAIGLPSIFKSTPSAPEDLMRKNAEVLFPNALAMKMGCIASVAKPFNPQGLSKYLGEELKLLASGKDTKSKQKAMEGITRISNYVKGLTICSTSAKDVNFNKSIAAKFPLQGGKTNCSVPNEIASSPVSVKVGTIDTIQIYNSFIGSLYNTKENNISLCNKVASTTQQVSNNQEGVRIAKVLGVPTGITASATYLAFGEKLTAPLATPGVANNIMKLNQLDSKTFTNHFMHILKGVSAKENASKNPKSVTNVVQGCKGEMGKVNLPLIQQVCQAAQQTHTQNINNARISQLKNELGAPANAAVGLARYKIFDTGLVKNWINPGAAQKMVEWNKLDPNGSSQHLSMILRGLQSDGKNTLNPNSTKIVVDACQSDMGRAPVPFMSDICQAAQQTNAVNDVNNQISTLKSQLGIPSVGPVRTIITKTCSTQFLAKLNVDLVQKWDELDSAGATEYLDTLGQCFNGTKVNNPKMAHFIQDKCDNGLVSVTGAESLCSKAGAHIETYDANMTQKAINRFDSLSTMSSDLPSVLPISSNSSLLENDSDYGLTDSENTSFDYATSEPSEEFFDENTYSDQSSDKVLISQQDSNTYENNNPFSIENTAW